MGRAAALMILLSQLLLLWVALDPTGQSSIWFTFAGHPLVGGGVVLGLWALMRRLTRNAAGSGEH